MTDAPIEAAAAILSRPGLEAVVDELARRLGASNRPVTSVTVVLPDDGARTAVAGLLGLNRLPPTRLQIRTERLTRAVGIDFGDLRTVVEAVAGPLGNRAAARAEARQALTDAAAVVAAAAEPLGPAAVTWAETAIRTLPGPIDERRGVVAAALAAVSAPRDRHLPLPVLAADVLGDPHAFDPGTRGNTVLVACAAAAAGVDVPRGALERRRLLGRFGIVADELSSTVALWRFPFPTGHPLADTSDVLTAAGEPLVVTLSMLQRWPLATSAELVLLVENPAVLAVAAARGHQRPLICSSGQPSAACTTLVGALRGAGTEVAVHADFDPGGFAVVGRLCELGAVPWRMGGGDYLAALDRAGSRTVTGPIPATPWDPELAVVFAEHRRPVYEEQILDVILS